MMEIKQGKQPASTSVSTALSSFPHLLPNTFASREIMPPASVAQTVCCKELHLTLQFVVTKGSNALPNVEKTSSIHHDSQRETDREDKMEADLLLHVDHSA